jgi:hypothetical protein
MMDAKDKTEAVPKWDANPERPAAPTSLGGMTRVDLDWIEKWLIQKRGIEHAARPHGKGSLLITTLIFEVRRERRHRDKVRGGEANHMDHVTAAEAQRIGSGGVRPGEHRTTYSMPRDRIDWHRGVWSWLLGLGLPLLIAAAVVAGLMWWHTGGVLPQ